MARQERWIGGAGTGKTKLIEGQLSRARKELGLATDEVGLCTFTRAGRQELSERVAASWGCDVEALTKFGWFRTAHSIAFQQAQVEDGSLLQGVDGDAWVSGVLGTKVTTARQRDSDVDPGAPEGDPEAATCLQAWEMARQTMRPLAAVVEDMAKIGDTAVQFAAAERLVDRYERAKAREGRVDYTDVISLYAGIRHTTSGPVETTPVGDVPERLRVLAIDEAQDSSAIVDRICRRLAASPHMERVLSVGDPFQCQPEGTPVLTSNGYKAIEDLDPETDLLLAYDTESRQLVPGCKFQKAWRPAPESSILDITFSDGTTVSCTDNHKWFISEVDGFVYASDLIAGEHSPPTVDGRLAWVESVKRRESARFVVVYSLNVEKHHTYVTEGGIVTGNSIYGFGGSDFRHFLAWEADEKIMPQSYRCPREIMDLGEKCLRQMKRGYRDRGIRPAEHRGTIRRSPDAHEAVCQIDPSRSVLILARVGFALRDYEEALKERKIPYSYIDRITGGVTLSGYKCLWDLEHGEVVSGDEWEKAIAMISVASKSLGPLLKRGEKTAWKDGKRANIDWIRPVPEDLELAGCTEQLVGLILSGNWPAALEGKHSQKAADWRGSAVSHGIEIACNPRVRLSTIHSAKGCEAEDVILSTVSCQAVENARYMLDERHDEECRVNYVAVTRARKSLTIVDDGDRYSLELPA